MLFILVFMANCCNFIFQVYPTNAEYVQVFFLGNITCLMTLEGNGYVSCFTDFTLCEKCKITEKF